MDINPNETVVEDDDTSVVSAFKSVRDPSAKNNRAHASKSDFIHTKLSIVNVFMVDRWSDPSTNNRISVQFQVSTGVFAHTNLNVRVSSDGMSLVISHKSSKYMTNHEKALMGVLLKRGLNKSSCTHLLEYHPKCIARKKTMSKLNGRDMVNTDLEYECRIPLPCKCRHKVTNELDGDKYFYGMNYFEYGNGEIWCHVELIMHILDDFQAASSEPELNMMDADPDIEEDETYRDEHDDETILTDLTPGYTAVHTATTRATQSKAAESKSSKTSSRNSKTPTRRSTRTPKKSAIASKLSPTAKDYSIVPVTYPESQVAPPVSVIFSPSPSTKGGPAVSSQTFMTPHGTAEERLDVVSVDDSTIRTLDTYFQGKLQAAGNEGNKLPSVKASVQSPEVWSVSDKGSKKSGKKSLSSPKKRTSSVKKSSSSGTVKIDDRSRSGRSSSTRSRSSKYSDTPTVKNSAWTIQNFIGPVDVEETLLRGMVTPPLTIPLANMPKLDENARITRSSTKRVSDTKSHSSDESHQNQVPKWSRSSK